MIICGFPGVGKSYLSNRFENYHDSDSSKFSWLEPGVRDPEFPNNYIKHIKSLPKDDFILVSTHAEVIDALIMNDLEFILVYPERHCKEEYLERYRKRKSPESFIKLLDKMWDTWIDDMESTETLTMLVLDSGLYMSDYQWFFEKSCRRFVNDKQLNIRRKLTSFGTNLDRNEDER